MAKRLIYQDKEKYQNRLTSLEKERADVQRVVDLYNATGLKGLEPGAGDLSALVNNTRNFLYLRLTRGMGAKMVFGDGDDSHSLPIDDAKAMELIAKPAGYNALLEGIKELAVTSIAGGNQGHELKWNVSSISSLFVIDAAGDVALSEKQQKELDETGNYYVRTDKGKRLHKFALAIIEAAKDNNVYDVNHTKDLHGIIDMIFDNPYDNVANKSSKLQKREWYVGPVLASIDNDFLRENKSPETDEA